MAGGPFSDAVFGRLMQGSVTGSIHS
jgi:hypothetical protein